jgi:hypothetical protein
MPERHHWLACRECCCMSLLRCLETVRPGWSTSAALQCVSQHYMAFIGSRLLGTKNQRQKLGPGHAFTRESSHLFFPKQCKIVHPWYYLPADIRERIDRMISATLQIPVCVVDSSITSPLYHGEPDPVPWTMAWLLDCPDHDSPIGFVDLTTFSHMCRFRHIQSRS